MTLAIKRVNSRSKPIMQMRNATTAVIGAGDYIGAAIARKFAAEGFFVFAGRRDGDKLAPLAADIEAHGGRVVARQLDARNEDQVIAFLKDADACAPLEICICAAAWTTQHSRAPSSVFAPLRKAPRASSSRKIYTLLIW
jgi:NAD(P)-dependent dehydrogenase (short-subunit alcohol dehydrogenase family)